MRRSLETCRDHHGRGERGCCRPFHLCTHRRATQLPCRLPPASLPGGGAHSDRSGCGVGLRRDARLRRRGLAIGLMPAVETLPLLDGVGQRLIAAGKCGGRCPRSSFDGGRVVSAFGQGLPENHQRINRVGLLFQQLAALRGRFALVALRGQRGGVSESPWPGAWRSRTASASSARARSGWPVRLSSEARPAWHSATVRKDAHRLFEDAMASSTFPCSAISAASMP